ncbi:MAG TPA: hypothetical protein VMT32_13695 [Bryobacteraceae bacterium]|nr:hypothetical protein [Bryobacteraceae bacterium]
MLLQGRDASALIYLDRLLGELREEFLAAAMKGEIPGPAFWETGERRAFAEMRSKFFSRDARAFWRPKEIDIPDVEDFASRTQRHGERALAMTHRKLKNLPYVGHPDYREDS